MDPSPRQHHMCPVNHIAKRGNQGTADGQRCGSAAASAMTGGSKEVNFFGGGDDPLTKKPAKGEVEDAAVQEERASRWGGSLETI